MTLNEPNAEAAESAIRQIGKEFRRLRSVRGERIEDIAAYLDIKVTYLFGVEQGDLSVIPGRRRAKSVIRSYADYLGLDGDSIVAPMDPIIANLKGAMAPPGSQKDGIIDRTSAIILAASVVLGVLVGWIWIDDSEQFDLLTAPIAVEQEAAVASADPAVDESPVEQDDVVDVASEGNAEALLAEIETALAEPSSQGQVDDVASDNRDDQPASPKKKEERPVNVLAKLVAERGDGAHIYESDNTDARVIVRALADVSVRVSSQGRDYTWTRTMKPREMLLVPNRDDLELWTGDAAGIEVLLDGAILPPLGPEGSAISGLSLAPASLEVVASTSVAEDGTKPTF